MAQYEVVLLLHSAPLLLNIIAISTLYLVVSSSAVTAAYNERISCTDPTISLSYKDSTISGTLLHVLFLVLPLILLSGCIIRRHYRGKRSGIAAPTFQELRWRYKNTVASPLLRTLHLYILGFAIGACTTIMLTDVLKYGIGRPRPHFLKLCMPHACITNRTAAADFTCSNSALSMHLLKNLRLSFPSGHSSLAAYASTFLTLFLQNQIRRVRKNGASVSLFYCQVLVMCSAILVGLSRIRDHKHHIQDVAVGLTLGALMALVTWIYVFPAMRRDLRLFPVQKTIRLTDSKSEGRVMSSSSAAVRMAATSAEEDAAMPNWWQEMKWADMDL